METLMIDAMYAEKNWQMKIGKGVKTIWKNPDFAESVFLEGGYDKMSKPEYTLCKNICINYANTSFHLRCKRHANIDGYCFEHYFENRKMMKTQTLLEEFVEV